MRGQISGWRGALRRPLPRWVWMPVAGAALAGLMLILVARQFPAGRAALWRVYATAARLMNGGGDVTPMNVEAAKGRLRARLGAELALPVPEARIVVRKKDRRLELYSGERLIKACAITMSRHADQGHKERLGDGCTPEGRYYVCTRNEQSRFHLFLGLSYPNAADAARGVERKLIDAAQREAIAAAEAARTRPPWDTKLGGEVGIHGGGTQPAGWTMGCIAVENPDIEELWVATAPGTPVEIGP